MADPIFTPLIAVGLAAGAYQQKRQKETLQHSKERGDRLAEDAENRRRENEQRALMAQSYQAQRALQKKRQLASGTGSTNRTGPIGLPGGGQKFQGPTLIGGGY